MVSQERFVTLPFILLDVCGVLNFMLLIFQDNFAMAKNVKMNPQYIDEIYFLQLQCINTTAQVLISWLLTFGTVTITCRFPGVYIFPPLPACDLHAAMQSCFAVVNSSTSEGMASALLEVSQSVIKLSPESPQTDCIRTKT